FQPLPPPESNRGFAAIDGGSRVADYEAFSIYMVRAKSVCLKPRNEEYVSCGRLSAADVGLLLPPYYEEERTSIYREILEAWVAARVLERSRPEMILMDGSLTPIVARRRPHHGLLREDEEATVSKLRELGIADSMEEIVAWLQEQHDRAPLIAPYLASRLALDELLGSDDTGWLSFLEWLEKLVAYRRLFEEAFNRGSRIVFVSKSSRSTELFEKALPDVYYLRRISPFKTGYTRPKLSRGALELRRLREVSGRFYPESMGLRDFYDKRLASLAFYVRLESGAPILRVEVVIDASLEGIQRLEGSLESMVAAVVSKLRGMPVSNGYPLILKMAHMEARIDAEDSRRVEEALGLTLERESRYVVG
ncbi:MAG: DNA double-strand break repair nuclease NurA, partial [Desulfurococcales archaeon]|nr:DNA double-strand break repair nuclease NurA [Desulfurococcales archaeon]